MKEENLIYVVQINGKKRGVIQAKNEASKENLLDAIKNDLSLSKYLTDRQTNKIIYVPNKLINIII